MKFKHISLSLILISLFSGCSSPLGEPKPPSATILVEKQTHETKMGSYCWGNSNKGVCADTAGPVELLENEASISVKPGETVRIQIKENPTLTESHLTQIQKEKEQTIPVQKGTFTAPEKEGSYLYAYSIRTKNGDVFYAFSLTVKK